jgi:dTDP-4-amino-4,6-dideoxygalactose transaminase
VSGTFIQRTEKWSHPVTRDPRRAYKVVDMFEEELCVYTRAPFAIAVDSCTNALFLSLVYEHERSRPATHRRVDWAPVLTLPRRTYVGVLQAVRNAGYVVEWARSDWHWEFMYDLEPTRVIDAARCLTRKTFDPGHLVCVSFDAGKQLPLGRGGAILTDDKDAAQWLRAARMDGRPPGAPIGETQFPGFHCPLPPDTAARGLWILSRWVDSGYDPPPLPAETYPDLSTL